MSEITDGFEKSELLDLIDAELGGQNYLLAKGLLDHTRALEAMLRKLENSAEGRDMGASWKTCPVCYHYPGEPHYDDCELARLLK